jgi:hypothetical protein
MKIVTKHESPVTDDIPISISSSRDEILFVSKNCIHCRRNSPLIENKSAAAAKLIRWLQRIIPVSIFLNFFGCFHISKKNIKHKRRNSSHREKNSAATDKGNHLLQKIIPLSPHPLLQRIRFLGVTY